MSRTITGAMTTAISGSQVNTTFLLIDIGFSTPIYLTTSSKQVTWNSNTYLPTIGYVSFEKINETAQIRVGTTELVLSGANLANISSALSENYTDVNVVRRRAVLDGSGAIIADPIVEFDGQINRCSIVNDPKSGQSLVTWELTSHWAQFEKTAGRRANLEDNKLFFPSDTGFEFASEIVKDLKWGRQ